MVIVSSDADRAGPSTPRVVCLGDLLLDVLITGGDHDGASLSIAPGGSAANTAAWLVAAGVPTALVGAVGDDMVGDLLALDLRRCGVQPALRIRSGTASGTFAAQLAGGTYQPLATCRGANDLVEWGAGEAALLRRAQHLHVSGYVFAHPVSQACAEAAAGDARRLGKSVSLDLGAPHTLRALAPEALAATLRALAPDILFCNEEEANTLLALQNVGSAAASAALLRWAPLAVLKQGARGSSAAGRRWADGPVVYPAPRGPVADAVGAGDAFVAGFLAAWLAEAPAGDTANQALALLAQATQSAATCLGNVGGRPARRAAP